MPKHVHVADFRILSDIYIYIYIYVVVFDGRLFDLIVIEQRDKSSVFIFHGTCSNDYALNRYVPEETSFNFCLDSLHFVLNVTQLHSYRLSNLGV
jgi:hypothetical protein